MFPRETLLISRRSFIALALTVMAFPLAAEEAAPIVRKAVESSNLTSIGYDARLKILEVEFHSGGVYRYREVPKEVFAAFMAADSKGRYFTAHVRNEYRFERMKAASPALKP
jgi:hypothetical protein